MSPTRREFASLLGAGALGTLGRPAVARQGRELRIVSTNRFTNLSLFGSTTGSKAAFLEPVYDPGIAFHPDTGVPIPWAVEDWGADEDRYVGTATVREGLTFTDGTPLTAADVAFTVEQVAEQRGTFLGPGLTDDELAALDDVRTPDERTVEIDFSEPVGRWRNLLANPIVPKHVWRDATDRERDLPDHDMIFGSGPYVVESASPTQGGTLLVRDDVTDHPLVDGRPAVERVDLQWERTDEDAVQAVAEGRADLAYEPIRDESLRDQGDVDLASSPGGGWDGVVFNLRRTPLDDPAFRGTLARCFDDSFFEARAVDGPDAVGGDLAVPDCFSFFQPAVADAGERYAFLGSPTGPVDVAAARSYLLDHDERAYDYSVGDAASDAVDDEEVYVDGVPLSEAHTDDDGSTGQGTLRFVTSDTWGDHVVDAIRKWVEDLRRVGIPAELVEQDYFDWYDAVFRKEAFDGAHLPASGPTPGDGMLYGVFHSSNADPESGTGDARYNPSNYAGADEQLRRARETMSPGARRAALRRATGRIHDDCPVLVMGYTRTVQTVAADWRGGVDAPGGVVNRFTLLGRDSVPSPPSASGTVAPEDPLVGQPVTLEDDGSSDPDGEIRAITWDAGPDGTVDGTGPSAAHAFDEAGTRRVLLQVVDDDGLPDEAEIEVAVGPNEPPEPVVEVRPSNPTAGTTVTLDAAGSTDPDTGIETFEWDVGADGSVDATGDTAEVTVEEAGEVVVRLQVVDEYGVEATTDVRMDVEATETPEEADGGASSSSDGGGTTPGTTGSAGGTGAPGFGLGAALLAGAGAGAALARRAGADGSERTGDDPRR